MQVAAQNEEETKVLVACRPKQGRNKMPKGRSLITKLDELGCSCQGDGAKYTI